MPNLLLIERTFKLQINIGHEVELVLPDMGYPDQELLLDGPLDLAPKEFCAWVAGYLSTDSSHWVGVDRDEINTADLVVKPEHDLDPINFIDDQFAGIELITPPRSLAEAQSLREEISRIISGPAESMSDMDRGPGGYGWHVNLDIDGAKPDILDFFLNAPEMAVLIETERSEIWGCRTLKNSVMTKLLDRRLGGDTSTINEAALRACLETACLAGKEHAANFQRSNYVELRHYGTLDFLYGEPLEEIIDRLCLKGNFEPRRHVEILKLNATVDLLERACRAFESRFTLGEEHHGSWFGERTQTMHLDGELMGIYRGKAGTSQASGNPWRDKASLLITGDLNLGGLSPRGDMAEHLSVEVLVNAYDYAMALDREHVASFARENTFPEAFQRLIHEVQDTLSFNGLMDRERDVASPGIDWGCDDDFDL